MDGSNDLIMGHTAPSMTEHDRERIDESWHFASAAYRAYAPTEATRSLRRASSSVRIEATGRQVAPAARPPADSEAPSPSAARWPALLTTEPPNHLYFCCDRTRMRKRRKFRLPTYFTQPLQAVTESAKSLAFWAATCFAALTPLGAKRRLGPSP